MITSICKMGAVLLCGAMLWSAAIHAPVSARSGEVGDSVEIMKEFEGIVNAPEFPPGLDWLNVDQPLRMADLRGKIVLLDFWTYCCINCMHVIPDLKKLEEKYADELVVIGVHSAKFTNEKGTEAIRQAVLRYDVEHPVVNDSGFQIWNEYAVKAWPTFVLINPKGKIIGTQSGENIYALFDAVIGRLVDYFDARGLLERGPVDLDPERRRMPRSLLSFPGKVSADAKSGRLFITDSNNDRIIITDTTGAILDVIGSGVQGNADGGFDEARFNRPQGTFLDGQVLYIADTDNHLIRRADPVTREVITILGTGAQARKLNVPGIGTGAALNSPWDVLVRDGTLYIAMAGAHQIWAADLGTLEAAPFAGSAAEALVDGPRLEAALAQPSGLAAAGDRLYFADSETSAIRYVELHADGRVETIIGRGLFEYGDRDGNHHEARLQHPLGIAVHDDAVWIADTYNSKVKRIDPDRRFSRTVAGTGESGYADGPFEESRFFEPGGLAFIGEKLYVADVNNHAVRVLDIEAGSVGTLTLANLERLHRLSNSGTAPLGRRVQFGPYRLMTGTVTLEIMFQLPTGYAFAEEAPHSLRLLDRSGGAVLEAAAAAGAVTVPDPTQGIPLQLETTEGRADLVFEAVVYFCETGSKICLVDRARLEISCEVTAGGSESATVTVPVSATGEEYSRPIENADG